jgi:hypothetical protein
MVGTRSPAAEPAAGLLRLPVQTRLPYSSGSNRTVTT